MVIINNGKNLELICNKGESLMMHATLSEFPEVQNELIINKGSIRVLNPEVQKELLAELLEQAGIRTYI